MGPGRYLFTGWLMERVTESLQKKASELGFLSVGIAPAAQPPTAAHLDTWLARGMAADMAYLRREPERRKDPVRYWPAARTVIALTVSYAPVDDDPVPRALEGVIARYARLSDYHRWMKKRLHRLGAYLQALAPGSRYLACVDTSPLLERGLASMAGLGWIGKNGMLIHKKWGSYTFLGFVLLDHALDGDLEAPPQNLCGTCRACLDACPTGALVTPHVLDARKCLSYHTIENRGTIPQPLRPLLGNRVFGCDICQEVCPWTRKANTPPPEGHSPPRTESATVDLTEIALDTPESFATRWQGTPVKRAKRHGMARNAAVALGNSPDHHGAVDTLVQLMHDDHPIVRAHAAWALGRQGGPRARRALEQALLREGDLEVQSEISRALESA